MVAYFVTEGDDGLESTLKVISGFGGQSGGVVSLKELFLGDFDDLVSSCNKSQPAILCNFSTDSTSEGCGERREMTYVSHSAAMLTRIAFNFE